MFCFRCFSKCFNIYPREENIRKLLKIFRTGRKEGRKVGSSVHGITFKIKHQELREEGSNVIFTVRRTEMQNRVSVISQKEYEKAKF